jgi:enoyl-CoA hydratase/carnithine racemase
VDLARAIGAAAPLAVRSVRATLRRELLAALPAAMDHENAERIRLSRTRDARAGIRAAVSGASRFSRGSNSEGPD